jgi:hypothetical protein
MNEPEPEYQVRFIQPDQARELVGLFHLAVTVEGRDRHARMQRAAKWFAQEHRTVTALAAYKDLEGLLS